LAIISAATVILTAGYILWTLQRVYLGAEYKGPHGDHLHPSDFRENLIGTTLCVFAILYGIFPYQFPGGSPSVLKYMDATIDQQVADLATWTREEDQSDRNAAATAQAGGTAGLPSSAVIEPGTRGRAAHDTSNGQRTTDNSQTATHLLTTQSAQ